MKPISRVKGKWKYLYRAVDSSKNTIDFMLSVRRDKRAAKRFFRKALKEAHSQLLRVINVDKNERLPIAVDMTKKEIGDRRQNPRGNKTMLLDDGGFKPLRIKYGFPEIFVASVVTPEETRLDDYKPLRIKYGVVSWILSPISFLVI